ncbi:MAG TPA: type II toxin-antitoxin system prevent-host-death family antitoxin, partial [Candidatus Dormibacteraeota bacterium]
TSGLATVGVRELRDHLSRYLEDVKRGRQLVVTEHGRQIARLVPASAAPDPLADLIAADSAQPPRVSSRALPRPVKGAGGVSDLVAQQRR